VDRFWAKVDKSGDCWLWIGATNKGGYGSLTINRKTYGAHRIAIQLAGIEIPPGLHVDHKCRNRLCVNPDHLRLVTPRQNVLENSMGLAALNAAKTHCPKEHPYTPENVYLYRGRRYCRKCSSDRLHKRWADKKFAAGEKRS